MSGEAVIETRGLTKHFGRVRALEDLELTVGRGEVFGYLGPNGAGKTTTIRLMLDFLRPTAGEVSVLGGTGADPEIRRRIGYLPGDLRIDPRYTGADVIAFYGGLRGGADPAMVDDLLERFELDPTRPIGQLSTGNRRKVGILAAFMHRPELLVLDEPTSGLDPLLQHEFQAVLRQAVADGATVFLSSHILPEVEALAGRVAILRRGRLVRLAAVEELYAQARSRLELHLSAEVDDPASVFAGVPEAVETTVADGVVHLVVEGSVDRVLKAAACLPVRRIVTHQADLEDVFLAYYQGDGREDGG